MKTKFLVTYGLLMAATGGGQFLAAQALSQSEILSQATRDSEIPHGRRPVAAGDSEGENGQKRDTRYHRADAPQFSIRSNIFMLFRCKTDADNAAYEKEFSGLFNYATVPFYWWGYEREQGHPNYESTDRVAEWCAAHHITMKGHPLVWNTSDPSWLPHDPAEAMGLQMQRVTDIVQRFKGRIDIFDVVNEATQLRRLRRRSRTGPR